MSKKKENTLSNFLPVNRKFFDHPFWKEKRTFSKSEAWLYLIWKARFEESEATELIGGKLVRWSRGQVPASIRFLAEDWMWSKGKVEDFLKMLEKLEQITRHQVAGQTVITLSNYAFYNGLGQQNGQQSGQVKAEQQRESRDRADSNQDSEADKRRTAGGHGPDNLNKDNIVKKEKEKEARSNLFYKTLIPHLEKYGKDLLRDFYNYWSEWNVSGTKMKWELKETWEVSKRLATWAKRDDNFKGDTQPQIQQNTKIKVK